MAIDYSKDFASFYLKKFAVEGAYGPQPIIPAFLSTWLKIAFPEPAGDPLARNIGDFRSKKQGKSSLAAAVACYMATRREYSEIVIAAADVDQAKDRVLRAVKFGVEHGPLGAHAKVFKDAVEFDNHSAIQAIPADWKGAAGGNYAAVIFDELHVYTLENQRRLFDELVIPPTVSSGVRWISSYAGWDGESLLLKEIWDRALLGDRLDKVLPIYLNRGASLLAFIDTGEASHRMPWMSPEYIAETKQNERPNTYRRLWLNEWVNSESQFLPEGAWDRCRSSEVRPLAPGERVKLVLGIDASTSRDSTAVVGVEFNPETNTTDVRLVKIWKPKKNIFRKNKPTIDLAETVGALVKTLHEAGQIDQIIVDNYQLHSLIMEWAKKYISVKELPQTTGRIESDQSLYDAVISGSLRHYGDPSLNQHISNAVALETPRGFRIVKEKSTLKMDGAVALSMANYGALEVQKAHGEDGITIEQFPCDPFDGNDHDFRKLAGVWVDVSDGLGNLSTAQLLELKRNADESGLTISEYGDPNEPGYPETFEQFFVERTPEGRALKERIQADMRQRHQDQRTINMFYRNAKLRR